MKLSSADEEFSAQKEFISKQFKCLHDSLKIHLTEVQKGQRQNEELQDVSEPLTTLQREIAEKDKELSNKDAVIYELQTYIKQTKVGGFNKARHRY